MPMYQYQCPFGCYQDFFLSIKQHGTLQSCDSHGAVMEQVISAPMMVRVAEPTIAYDSPVTGEHITSWHARREDLAKHNCQEYDPEMKKDAERRRIEQDNKLDAAIEETVEATIERMPTAKRGKLHSEMNEQGYDLAYNRATLGA